MLALASRGMQIDNAIAPIGGHLYGLQESSPHQQYQRTVGASTIGSTESAGRAPIGTIKAGDLFPDLHHKMSKKIAQLTKVIYHLNTKNEDRQASVHPGYI